MLWGTRQLLCVHKYRSSFLALLTIINIPSLSLASLRTLTANHTIMLLQVSLLSLLGAAAAVPAMNLSNRQAAGPGITILNISSQICGTAPPDETLRQAHANLRAKQGMQTRASSSPIVVQTYMHLVTTSDQAHNYPFNIRNILFSQQVGLYSLSFSSSSSSSSFPSQIFLLFFFSSSSSCY